MTTTATTTIIIISWWVFSRFCSECSEGVVSIWIYGIIRNIIVIVLSHASNMVKQFLSHICCRFYLLQPTFSTHLGYPWLISSWTCSGAKAEPIIFGHRTLFNNLHQTDPISLLKRVDWTKPKPKLNHPGPNRLAVDVSCLKVDRCWIHACQ